MWQRLWYRNETLYQKVRVWIRVRIRLVRKWCSRSGTWKSQCLISGENRLYYCPKSTGSLDLQPKCFNSVQLLSCVQLFVTSWIVPCQASLAITISWSLLKLMSIQSVMPSNHLILCHPFLLLPSIFHSTRVFSNGSILHIRWPKYWSISPSNEYLGLISFKIGWFDQYSILMHIYGI